MHQAVHLTSVYVTTCKLNLNFKRQKKKTPSKNAPKDLFLKGSPMRLRTGLKFWALSLGTMLVYKGVFAFVFRGLTDGLV